MSDDVQPTVEAAATELASRGLLTRRQALAYVLREIEDTPREETADRMGTTVSTLDSTLARARQKVESARQTIQYLDGLQNVDPADVPDDVVEDVADEYGADPGDVKRELWAINPDGAAGVAAQVAKRRVQGCEDGGG